MKTSLNDKIALGKTFTTQMTQMKSPLQLLPKFAYSARQTRWHRGQTDKHVEAQESGDDHHRTQGHQKELIVEAPDAGASERHAKADGREVEDLRVMRVCAWAYVNPM